MESEEETEDLSGHCSLISEVEQQGKTGQQASNSGITSVLVLMCPLSGLFLEDIFDFVHVCVGWLWMEQMSRLRHGTTAGLAGQLCFCLWSFKLPEGFYCLEVSRTEDVTVFI